MRRVLGPGVRRVREAAGVRQEDVSRAARAYGLAWGQSRVAALERGEKAIDAEELALLPVVLTLACGRQVTLAELIDPRAHVALSDTTTATGEAVVHLYAGKAPGNLGPTRLWRGSVADERDRLDATAVASLELWQRLRALKLTADVDEAAILECARGVGLTEERAAKRLGEAALIVAVAARALWGRPLAEERDRQAAARGDAGDDPERLRALRGRVTRELVSQLADDLARRTGDGADERQEAP